MIMVSIFLQRNKPVQCVEFCCMKLLSECDVLSFVYRSNIDLHDYTHIHIIDSDRIIQWLLVTCKYFMFAGNFLVLISDTSIVHIHNYILVHINVMHAHVHYYNIIHTIIIVITHTQYDTHV